MAKRSLRAQLNQIRAWAREGRTDAWIAHQLEVPAAELREFRRRHGLDADEGEELADADLRDEIEAEIEAAAVEEAEEEEEEEARSDEGDGGGEGDGEGARKGGRRRRRRRRGRGSGRKRKTLQGTFEHGEQEGYGLWLDPAIQDEPAYAEHWAGHRAVEVEVEPDRIVIKRSGTGSDADGDGDGDGD
jgi:hypothetical protein